MDDSHLKMGSVKQMPPQLNMISLIRAQILRILTAIAGTSISTGKAQVEFPEMEEANLLRSSSLNQTSSLKSNLLRGSLSTQKPLLPQDSPCLDCRQSKFRRQFLGVASFYTHHSYTPARASMPAPNSRQVTESHKIFILIWYSFSCAHRLSLFVTGFIFVASSD